METKSLETNHHSIEKPPRKSLIITDANKTPSDIRKSLENLDDKKSTPPPVLTKKPTVPIKKSPSVSTVAGSIFSGLKQKVKSVESKLHSSHDGTDGIASSKVATSQVADNSEKGVVGEKINELDTVERGSYLQDVRQNRAKAPKRRPPTSAGSLIGDSNNNSVSMNGSHTESSNDSSLTHETVTTTTTIISTSPAAQTTVTSHEEEVTVKPKAREWEKHKAPWMEELKANQARKTSPNVEHKSPDNDEKHDMSKSFSSSFSSTTSTQQQKKSATETFEVRASSMEVKSNSFDVFNKKDKEIHTTALSSTINSINSSVEASSAKSTTKISITDNSSSVLTSTNSSSSSTASVKVDDQITTSSNIRPTSVSLRNRSISPIPRTQITNHIVKPSPTNISATHITPIGASATSLDTTSKVTELELRVNKLESLVSAQNATIEELKKLLREESDKVKTLKMDLEKYAQCFTQV